MNPITNLASEKTRKCAVFAQLKTMCNDNHTMTTLYDKMMMTVDKIWNIYH